MELQLKGRINLLKGKLEEKYGELIDDDISRFDGKTDQLLGYLQVKLGKKKDDIEKEIASWLEKV
ncbi:MAG: CsbD family protein [Bacteroidia bacterium]